MQIDPIVAQPIGNDWGFFRTAIERNGANQNDNVFGLYVMSNGLLTRQDPITRTASFAVARGETVRFGAYLSGVPAGVSATWNVVTHHACY